jgi:hypothetical protein
MSRGRNKKKNNKKRAGNKKPITAKDGVFSIGKEKLNSFDYIEEMHAQYGVIRITLKDGRQETLTPSMAAVRCRAINEMKLPAWHAAKRDSFLERAIQVIREAKAQEETPLDKKTAGIQNVLKGLTAEGGQAPVETDEDKLVQKYMFQFPMLQEEEARAILRESALDMARKETLMEAVNKQRYAEIEFKPVQGP